MSNSSALTLFKAFAHQVCELGCTKMFSTREAIEAICNVLKRDLNPEHCLTSVTTSLHKDEVCMREQSRRSSNAQQKRQLLAFFLSFEAMPRSWFCSHASWPLSPCPLSLSSSLSNSLATAAAGTMGSIPFWFRMSILEYRKEFILQHLDFMLPFIVFLYIFELGTMFYHVHCTVTCYKCVDFSK